MRARRRRHRRPCHARELNALESSGGSTLHFEWSEFTDRVRGTFDAGKVSAAAARENARRCMDKLEALRLKLGNTPSDSMHRYSTAADLAETCGFSGLETCTEDHQHVDSRADPGRAWWWQDGTI